MAGIVLSRAAPARPSARGAELVQDAHRTRSRLSAALPPTGCGRRAAPSTPEPQPAEPTQPPNSGAVQSAVGHRDHAPQHRALGFCGDLPRISGRPPTSGSSAATTTPGPIAIPTGARGSPPRCADQARREESRTAWPTWPPPRAMELLIPGLRTGQRRSSPNPAGAWLVDQRLWPQGAGTPAARIAFATRRTRDSAGSLRPSWSPATGPIPSAPQPSGVGSQAAISQLDPRRLLWPQGRRWPHPPTWRGP